MFGIDDAQRYLQSGRDQPRKKANLRREAILERMYTRILIELCANRFRWTGLPASVDVRYMELTILYSGLSIFYFDEKYGRFLAMRGAPSGQRNFQDEPIAFTIPRRDYTGIGGDVKADRAVPIWGNYLQYPDLDVITVFAQRLAQIDRTIEINTMQARRPRILAGNKNQRHSLQMVNNQIDEGQAYIGLNNSIDPSQIQALDLGVNPQLIEQNHIARGRVWNQAMALLGINNANQDKKERLVADEVAANDEQVSAMKAVSLNARQHAAEEINRMFDGSEEHARITGYRGEPLNVEVTFNTEPDPRAESLAMLANAFHDTDSSTESESEGEHA